MAAAFVETVNILRISKVCAANSFRKRIFTVRRGDYVNMIVHKAIAENL